MQRFLNDEKPESICASLDRSKAWLYKWIERHIADDNSWSESQSRRPLSVTSRTPKEIEEIVKMVHLNLDALVKSRQTALFENLQSTNSCTYKHKNG